MLQRRATRREVSSASDHHHGKQTPGIVDKHPQIKNLDDHSGRVVTGELVQPGVRLTARRWNLAIHGLWLANPFDRIHQSPAGFSPPRNKPGTQPGESLRLYARRPTAAAKTREICLAAWKPAKGGLRSPDKLSSNHPPETVIQVVDFGMLVGNSWRLLPVVGVTAAETAGRADPR
jgi:hypothetical protein